MTDQQPTATLEDMAQACTQRAAVYGLLSRMYRTEVDQGFYDELKGSAFPAATGNDEIDLGYRKVATYLSSLSHGVLLDLARDYVRTFIGHRNDTHGAAYPFESVYTSEKRLLMQQARNEVLAIYRAAGMKVDEGWEDPEDHVALELEYMQLTALQAAQAASEGDEASMGEALRKQREFLKAHLLNWVPMLTQDMCRFAQTGFYQGLAHLTDGFLQLESEFFAELPNE